MMANDTAMETYYLYRDAAGNRHLVDDVASVPHHIKKFEKIQVPAAALGHDESLRETYRQGLLVAKSVLSPHMVHAPGVFMPAAAAAAITWGLLRSAFLRGMVFRASLAALTVGLASGGTILYLPHNAAVQRLAPAALVQAVQKSVAKIKHATAQESSHIETDLTAGVEAPRN